MKVGLPLPVQVVNLQPDTVYILYDLEDRRTGDTVARVAEIRGVVNLATPFCVIVWKKYTKKELAELAAAARAIAAVRPESGPGGPDA